MLNRNEIRLIGRQRKRGLLKYLLTTELTQPCDVKRRILITRQMNEYKFGWFLFSVNARSYRSKLVKFFRFSLVSNIIYFEQPRRLKYDGDNIICMK